MNRMHLWAAALAATALAASGCARPGADSHGHSHEHESWAVTSWGERYEIFAEAAPLAAGETSKSHTHVTILDGFAPLTEGVVTAVLVDSAGRRAEFRQDAALRAGIFSVEITPEAAGEFDLVFRVESRAGAEEIPSGRVRVGVHEDPGGVVVPPAPPVVDAGTAAPSGGAEPVSFLKEQQWRVPFATAWASRGSLNPSVGGPARVRAAAGGEAVLTAPLDGVVVPSGGLYVGLDVARGARVLELRPRAGAGRSYAAIESEWTLAMERLARLEALFAEEAVSRAELDRARALAANLRGELDAVAGAGRTVPVTSPLAGRVAEVMAAPGEAVAAGAPLARVVRTDPLWVEVGLRPGDAARLGGRLAGLVVQAAPGEPPVEFGAGAVRLVARAPELDRTTGLVQVLLEVRGTDRLRAGAAVQADVLLAGERTGVVLPAEAIVDDAGVPVVYVQPEGESFERREVRVLGRQGARVLVEGVGPADRIVTRGAAAVRRAAQMSTGAVEGHVH